MIERRLTVIAYIAKGEWKGVLDPDTRGKEEKVFLAYSDEDAREKAWEIADEERFQLQEILRVTRKGNKNVPLGN